MVELGITSSLIEADTTVVGSGSGDGLGFGGGGGGAGEGEGLGFLISIETTGGGGGGAGGAGPPPKSQLPWIIPTDSAAKKLKSPREKSRPPDGQPGHYSRNTQDPKLATKNDITCNSGELTYSVRNGSFRSFTIDGYTNFLEAVVT